MKTKCFTRNFWLFLGLSFILLNHVNAADTTFTFDEADNNQASIVKTVDGIEMTVSNGSDGNFHADRNDGIVVLANNAGFGLLDISISSFDIVFSNDVKLISYNVSYIFQLDNNEVITFTNNSSTSTENSPFTGNSSRDFATQLSVPANTTISVTNTGNDDNDLMMIKSLVVEQITIIDTVSAPIPNAASSPYRVPFAPITTLFIFLLGLGAITSVWRNRNKR